MVVWRRRQVTAGTITQTYSSVTAAGQWDVVSVVKTQGPRRICSFGHNGNRGTREPGLLSFPFPFPTAALRTMLFSHALGGRTTIPTHFYHTLRARNQRMLGLRASNKG